MSKQNFPTSIIFTALPDLTDRFAFVQDDALKTNVATTLQYIIFLLSLSEEYKMPGPVIYMIYKNIIILTGSIVESLTCHKLQEMIKAGRFKNDEIMKMEYRYVPMKEIFPISSEEKIYACLRTKKYESLNDKTQLFTLNRAAEKSGLFTSPLYRMAQKLRDTRNRIHLAALKRVDDQYSKSEVNAIFADAKKLIDRIESY